jgi:hypothetical protein
MNTAPIVSRVWGFCTALCDDYRTNVHHSLKQKPLTYAHLEDFVACYNPESRAGVTPRAVCSAAAIPVFALRVVDPRVAPPF